MIFKMTIKSSSLIEIFTFVGNCAILGLYCEAIKNKNRSAMRTWGLMLYASMLLFLSVGILFSNVSIWEFNCCKREGRQIAM